MLELAVITLIVGVIILGCRLNVLFKRVWKLEAKMRVLQSVLNPTEEESS